jgi:transposase InsO family protein
MGKVERFNRLAKEQALKRDDATQRAEIQIVCDSYRQLYNYKRPHQALARKTPASVVR